MPDYDVSQEQDEDCINKQTRQLQNEGTQTKGCVTRIEGRIRECLLLAIIAGSGVVKDTFKMWPLLQSQLRQTGWPTGIDLSDSGKKAVGQKVAKGNYAEA